MAVAIFSENREEQRLEEWLEIPSDSLSSHGDSSPKRRRDGMREEDLIFSAYQRTMCCVSCVDERRRFISSLFKGIFKLRLA